MCLVSFFTHNVLLMWTAFVQWTIRSTLVVYHEARSNRHLGKECTNVKVTFSPCSCSNVVLSAAPDHHSLDNKAVAVSFSQRWASLYSDVSHAVARHPFTVSCPYHSQLHQPSIRYIQMWRHVWIEVALLAGLQYWQLLCSGFTDILNAKRAEWPWLELYIPKECLQRGKLLIGSEHLHWEKCTYEKLGN